MRKNGNHPHRIEIQVPLVCDYVIRKPESGSARETFLLLHGYSESAEKIFKKLIPVLPSDATVIALNGPFPLPEKKDDGYRVGFSWYFYDPKSGEYYLDMTTAIDFVVRALEALQLHLAPMTVIGFSQGGYLAPFVAQKLSSVKRVIGIGNEFLADELAGPLNFRMDQIMGALDPIINPSEARARFDQVKLKSRGGKFILLPETAHRIDEHVQKSLGELLYENC